MGIRFACHVCDNPLNIKRELAGRVGICPKCHGRFRIPRNDAAKSLPINASDSDVQPSGTAYDSAALAGNVATASSSSGVVALDQTVQSAPERVSTHRSTASPLDDAEAQWYVRPPAGGQYGPAGGDIIRTWIAENRITASTMVWRSGWTQWRSAGESLPEVSEPESATPTASAPPTIDSSTLTTASPATETVKLIGQAGIGQQRSARSQRRLTLIILLAVTSICLIGILIFIALRQL